MEDLFVKLVNLSITASWLIIAVLVLRLLFRKAPKWIFCVLWGLVALRLIFPFSIESILSLIPSAETLPADIIYTATPEIQSGINIVDRAVNSLLTSSLTPAIGASINPTQILSFTLSWIWLVGMAALLIYALISFIVLKRRVATATLLDTNIKQSEEVDSPFVLGLFRPTIYMPYTTDEIDRKYVIAHERAHISRLDHWWKTLGFVLLAVYWFNPLLWVAYILFCRDMETACDEKVIKEMTKQERQAYATALLNCSVYNRRITACPLAFGEVSVKDRVKSVMNYKKPAFWLIVVAVVAIIITAVCLLTNPRQGSYDLKIVVPAGSQETFVYANEEISPTGNHITVSAGENLGDTEVVLQPVEVSEENSYEPTYLTPGMPVKLDVEKGAWFKIGVNMQNTTDEDMIVYLHIDGIKVREPVSLLDELEQYRTDYLGDAPKVRAIAQRLPYPASEGYAYSSMELQTDQEPYELKIYLTVDGFSIDRDFQQCADIAFELIGNLGIISFYDDAGQQLASYQRGDSINSALTEAINAAIIEHNKSQYLEGDFPCVSFALLAEEEPEPNMITVYGFALYEEYDYSDVAIYSVSGVHSPVAITFAIDNGEYLLSDYWIPGDGAYYEQDIIETFPAEIVDEALDTQKYILMQNQDCYEQVIRYSGIDTNAAIEALFTQIEADPAAASDPKGYVVSHQSEYQELLYYGDYALRYIFEQFLAGGQTGLHGQLMKIVLIDLVPELTIKLDTENGQQYFDAWKANVERLYAENGAEWLAQNQPEALMLIQMMEE